MEYLDVEQAAANTGECGAYQYSILVPSCSETDHSPVMKVKQDTNICPCRADSHIGQVADYTGVWLLLVELALQKIRNGHFVTAFMMQTILLPWIGRRQSTLAHDPANFAAGHKLSGARQSMLEFALTVYTPILVKCSLTAFFQLGFIRSAFTFVIISTARNAKTSAQR